MRSKRFRASYTILFLCTVLVAIFVPLARVQGAQGDITTFRHTPAGYNNQTGSFALASQLMSESKSGVTGVCVMFDYFIFNAQGGQVLQGQVSPGSTGNAGVYYTILTSPIQLNLFWNSRCGRGDWQIQQFTSPSTISWTAPEDGQYALVFMVRGFYGGTLTFSPS